jgi:hypothetical protein
MFKLFSKSYVHSSKFAELAAQKHDLSLIGGLIGAAAGGVALGVNVGNRGLLIPTLLSSTEKKAETGPGKLAQTAEQGACFLAEGAATVGLGMGIGRVAGFFSPNLFKIAIPAVPAIYLSCKAYEIAQQSFSPK